MDVVGSEAGSHELIAVRPREVEVKSGGRPNAEPALYCVSGMAGLPERLDHFFANLAAADAKAGSNRRDEIALDPTRTRVPWRRHRREQRFEPFPAIPRARRPPPVAWDPR